MGYIEIPITTEPVDLADESFAYIEDKVPGWLPSPGNLEAWLVEALSQVASELRELIALVPDSIFEFYGESIVGIAPYQAVQATGTTTWTAIDGAGYTIYSGTLVGLTPPATADGYAFEVVNDVAIAPGNTVIAGVEIRALEAGAAASGITGAVQMLDTLDFIEGVTLDAPTSGGADAEDIDAYLDRLSDLFTLLTPRPILPQDFAILAQRSDASVARATAIDLYNPGPPVNANCPRCVTVVLVDANGNPVTPSVKAAVDAQLQAQREVNFLVFTADPTFSSFDVTAMVRCWPGYDPAYVQSLVVAQLSNYLSPSTWGLPPFGDTGAQTWINDTTVRYLELTEQVNRVDGVHYVETLTFGIHGGAQGTVDVVMTGTAPLPKPSTINVTANAA